MNVDVSVRFRTYAKINLFLRILGSRGDGFHEIETVLHGVSLFDEIEIERTDEDLVVTMEMLDGVAGTLPSDGENLVRKAAQVLRDEVAIAHGARVHVKKGIPIAAGLGGGSGNAAGVLVTLAEFWNLDIKRERLVALAEGLGSDVPYCIEGGTALATARGEKFTPLPNIRPMWFVLAGSAEPLLTREVYARWDSMAEPQDASVSALTMAVGAGDAAEVAAMLHNDLELPAFSMRPALQEKKQLLVDSGALGASMSGSGPTLFAIAESEKHAREVETTVGGAFDWTRIVSSQSTCIERL